MDRMGKALRAGFLACVLSALPSCGGGGGGGGSSPPFEMVYVLEESSSGSSGQVEYFPMNPGNGSFYPESGAGPVPTSGTVPIALLADPSHPNFLYALNNNNTTSGTTHGSVQGFSAAGYQKNMSAVGTAAVTGQNPVGMAIDPGGRYLAVADHGSGTSSGSGDVKVFTISSGTVSSLGTWSSSQSCANPFRVVFAPDSSGSSSDTVIVACSSPEIWGSSSNPGVAVYACPITNLVSGSCQKILAYGSISQNVSPQNFALVNFLFVPGTSTAVGPVLSGSSSGVPTAWLLVCDFASITTNSCSTTLSKIDSASPGFLPSGNVAFSGSGSSARLYVGNYYPSASGGFIPSGSSEFSSCSSSTSSSWTCSSLLKGNSSSTPGPIYFYATGNTLYIAATETPINGAYTISKSSTTSGGHAPTSGTLYACALSGISSSSPSCSSKTTGGWPVAITVDPQTGNYLFVPTLSGTVDLYSGASTGTLSYLTGPAVASGYLPLSVLVLP